MQKTNGLSKDKERVWIYLLALIASLLIAPFIAEGIGAQFKKIAYGQMVGVAKEFSLAILWLIALAVVAFFEYKRKGWLGNRDEKRFLPLKNVVIISAICVACVGLVTLQIGLQVKPFYDIGKKVVGYELLHKVAIMARNAVKCGFYLFFLHYAQEYAEKICQRVQWSEGWKKYLPYLLTGVCALAFGVYDVLLYQPIFWATYLVFCVAYTAIYFLTKRNWGKSYLLILFIYLF